MPKYELAKRPGFPNWYVVWSEHGRSRRCSTRTADRGEAQAFFAAFLTEIDRPAGKAATLASVLNAYLTQHAAHLPSKEQAEIAGKLLLAHYGDALVTAVTLQSQDDYIAKRRKAKVADETISRELSVLRAAVNRAKKYDTIDEAPFVKSLPKAPARERYITRTEAARLLRSCAEAHVRDFVRLALYTGARRGAILELTWDRVDFTQRLLYFPLPGRAQTNKRSAVVPFEGALYTALQRAKRRSRSKYVISYHGRGVDSIKTGFRNACRVAKLKKVTPHTLRHTAATWAAQNGEDLWRIAGMLGHENMRTVQRYAHHQPGHLRSTARAIMRGVRQNMRQAAE
jgi:integrase